MDAYFGKIKSTKYIVSVYNYSNMKEYIESQNNHIRHLETIISTMVGDIILLDHKVRNVSKTKDIL